MDLDAYLPLLLALPAVPVTRWLANRCHPRTATWALVVTGVVLATASTISLGVLAIAGFTGVASGALIGVLAGIALSASVGALGRAGFRHVRTLRAAHAEARLHPDTDVVVLADEAPVAYALPGAPGRVVVSTGMLAVLDDAEQRVLLAHERAHLADRHHLFLGVAAAVAAANPLLRPLRTAAAYTVERWADEVAAERVGSRRTTARAVGKAALATRRTPSGHAAALHAATGPVPRRVSALLTAPPSGRGTRFRAAALAAVALLVLTAVSSLDAADDLHEFFEETGITAR